MDSLADELVAEFEHGVGETGVRPGIIGEIGTDKPWVSALEERVHRAAARAAIRTGMAVSTHGVQSTVGQAQLDIFLAEGMDPGGVVIGHADSWPDLDHYLAILDRGANLQFDFLGHRFDPVDEAREPRVVELLVDLLDRGYGSPGPAQPGRVPRHAAEGQRRLRLYVPPAALPACAPDSGRR